MDSAIAQAVSLDNASSPTQIIFPDFENKIKPGTYTFMLTAKDITSQTISSYIKLSVVVSCPLVTLATSLVITSDLSAEVLYLRQNGVSEWTYFSLSHITS